MRQSEVLKKFSMLTESQKSRIRREVDNLLSMNASLSEGKPDRCPKWQGSFKMISHGQQNGKRRFICKGCHSAVTYDSHTIMSNLKISKDEFIEICRDTLDMVPIARTATRLDRSVPTVHLNRHKCPAVLEEMLEDKNFLLAGTVEIDETYELESTKGISPQDRESRKRGKASSLRGISHEQVCIVTATERNGHEIFKAAGFGKPPSESITSGFGSRIKCKSVIYSDGVFSYDRLSSNTGCKLVQLYDYGMYNIVEHLNTVNSIHKTIKDAFSFYRGIATKYMNRYMSLFVFIRRFMQMDGNEKIELLIRRMKTFHCTITRKSLRNTHLFID